MEEKETTYFLMNIKMIMNHGNSHIKNNSRLNIMLGIHNAHYAVETIIRWKARDYIFNDSLSEMGFEKILKRVNEKMTMPPSIFNDLLLLNKARNDIQHKYYYPDHERATDLVQGAEKYLKWGFEKYFEADYDFLKLETMIYDGPIRDLMLQSKNAINTDLKLASENMYTALADFKSWWFMYLSDHRVRDQVYRDNLDLPNLLADLAFKIILSEDQNTLKKLLQIGSRWVQTDRGIELFKEVGFLEFRDEEEALEYYDSILGIILHYQDKVPNWRES